MIPPRSASQLNLFFLAIFAVLAGALGYWTFVARASLLTRPDNPRALIAFNRIQRGRILDRNGLVLAETVGEPGDYVRHYERAAALVTGYASFTYGLSSIEAAANDTLTGSNDLDDTGRWWHYSVLNEPQIGHDVTLTLDLNLQRAAYIALDGQAGTVVVLDSLTGEVLVMASSPSFDPAQLDDQFKTFTDDSNGPLINRATLGLYPADDLLSRFPDTLDLSQTPALPINVLPAQGKNLTPLHAALLIAALDNDGVMPVPHLILGQDPPAGSHPVALVPPTTALDLRTLFINGYNATTHSGFKFLTLGWYAALHPDTHQVIVVVLENNDADHAKSVATQTLAP